MTVRLWTTAVYVTFQAPDAERASTLAGEIAGRCLLVEEVWSAEGEFEPDQRTETVDE